MRARCPRCSSARTNAPIPPYAMITPPFPAAAGVAPPAPRSKFQILLNEVLLGSEPGPVKAARGLARGVEARMLCVVKPGDHPEFFRFPAPEGRSRESTIRLDAEGHFFHEGHKVEHPKLAL